MTALVPERTTSASRAARTQETVARLADATGPDRERLVEELVLANLEVAETVSARYRGRGIPDDDLHQVARTALVRAAHGFDPASGHDFLSYAVPTMRGALRRHFRDHGWMVRPPRRVQELVASTRSAAATLRSSLGREPTPAEIASVLDQPVDDVVEALACDGCYSPASLDRPVREDGDAPTLGETLAATDDPTAAAEARIALAPAVRRLGPRDRRILQLRYVEECSQREIAADIGVSQVQVSRLLGRIVDRLREDLGVPLRPAS